MKNSVLQGLHYKENIELYYSLDRKGTESESVWWPATVEVLSFTHDSKGPIISASIRFSPLHGFRSSVQNVVFDKGQQVRDEQNVFYSLRFLPVAGQSDSDSQSQRSEDLAEAEEET